MKSDIISVSNSGRKFEAALREAEAVAAYKHLSPRSAIQLRLLAEEMMSMMRSIAGPTEGEFWIEEDDLNFVLHLEVFKRLSEEKREQLISSSTSGKNEATRGFLGKIRAFFDTGDPDIPALTHGPLLTGTMDGDFSSMQSWEWSMLEYRNALSADMANNEASREAWDELEKSVLANVADDVKVSIKGAEVELTVYKKLTQA